MKKLALKVAVGLVVVLGVLHLVSGDPKALPTSNHDSSNRKLTNSQKAEATVKVVRMDERSGGTGVILHSDKFSFVLTNNHVCEVVKNGGFVITDNNTKYLVVSYRQSKLHDLCLITVDGNLGVETNVSSDAPFLYDAATVSGHPSLLPTIITSGHYSQNIIGQIMVGVKPCSVEDYNGPYGIYCIFMGGLPIIRSYEMTVVSATIKPGSSGSAVYNSNGEITNLIFAGSGELGYGLAVPYPYLVNFLSKELSSLTPTFPSNELVLKAELVQSTESKCKLVTNPDLYYICKLMEKNLLYVE